MLRVMVCAAATLVGIRGTQDAAANGDTRTITILHEHTKESATVTFKRNGYYDQGGLNQLNVLLRDWRTDEQTRMEPKLFDVVWEVYREVGSREPIRVVSAYRAPETNAMLRRRSRAVAEHSQHMAGKAMDFYLPDVPMSRVREIGMRLQNGGVGFYPNAYNPFVHLDAGSVRSWPRMTSDQLARLFPDGRTVHLPRDGKPLPGYETAKAEILARGGAVAGLQYAEGETGGERKSLWATLFGNFDDEDSDFYRSSASRGGARPRAGQTRVAAADIRGAGADRDDAGVWAFNTRAPSGQPAEAAPQIRGYGQDQLQARLEPESLQTSVPAVAPRVPPAAPAEARSAPDPIVVSSLLPTPPRRPEELGALLVAMPLPPIRPGTPVAGAAPVVANDLNGQMRSLAQTRLSANDDRAALRALFDAASTSASPSRTHFSSAGLDDMSVDRFRGSAVAPRPTIR